MTGLTIANKTDFSEMDNAGISKEHWKIMFISGMGFFTDAYDLFVIGVVSGVAKAYLACGQRFERRDMASLRHRSKKQLLRMQTHTTGSLTGAALANAGASLADQEMPAMIFRYSSSVKARSVSV